MTHSDDRRQRVDRRIEDRGPPPGWLDRRRRTERRLPDVDEHECSDEELSTYFSQYVQSDDNGTTVVTISQRRIHTADGKEIEEIAADILSRHTRD